MHQYICKVLNSFIDCDKIDQAFKRKHRFIKSSKKTRSGLKKIKSILFLTSKVDGEDKDGSEDGSRPDRGDDRCNNQDCWEQLHVEEEHLEPVLKTLKVEFVTKLLKLKNCCT